MDADRGIGMGMGLGICAFVVNVLRADLGMGKGMVTGAKQHGLLLRLRADVSLGGLGRNGNVGAKSLCNWKSFPNGIAEPR